MGDTVHFPAVNRILLVDVNMLYELCSVLGLSCTAWFIHTGEELDIHMYLFIAVGLQHAHYQLLDVLELVGGILQEITNRPCVKVLKQM